MTASVYLTSIPPAWLTGERPQFPHFGVGTQLNLQQVKLGPHFSHGTLG